MRSVQLYRYRLPMQSGVVLREHQLTLRQGLIVKLQQGEKIGWGEIAPLPFFSRESLAEAEAEAVAWLNAWCLQKESEITPLVPSVAFGLSCALNELAGSLNPEADFRSVPLFNGDLTQFKQKLSQAETALGKIKIGGDAETDGKRVNQLLTELPSLRLRLDANRRWGLNEAVSFAQQITKETRSQIEFIEEPCLTPELSCQFAELSGIRIAWDETLRETDYLAKQSDYLTAYIIKPTLTGSLERCLEQIKQARSQGLQAVISSSLESSLALTQLARFSNQHTPSIAGLDTLGLMSFQLLRRWQGSNLPLVELPSQWLEPVIL